MQQKQQKQNSADTKMVTLRMPIGLVNAICEHQSVLSGHLGGAHVPFSTALMHLVQDGLGVAPQSNQGE
jgi:hypothetical protein